jgi:hypothetical protein
VSRVPCTRIALTTSVIFFSRCYKNRCYGMTFK